MFYNKIKSIFAIALIGLVIFLTGCGSKYNYYLYCQNIEDALKKGDYKKAQKLASYAYIQEKTDANADFEKRAWLFYRLGVIAELSGSLLHAKGYYWGDQIEQGFYNENKYIAWLAKTGWSHLDENNPSRSLAVILELERLEPPEEPAAKPKPKPVKRKPQPLYSNVPIKVSEGEITRRDTPFTYPPERRSRGLFKVAK